MVRERYWPPVSRRHHRALFLSSTSHFCSILHSIPRFPPFYFFFSFVSFSFFPPLSSICRCILFLSFLLSTATFRSKYTRGVRCFDGRDVLRADADDDGFCGNKRYASWKCFDENGGVLVERLSFGLMVLEAWMLSSRGFFFIAFLETSQLCCVYPLF